MSTVMKIPEFELTGQPDDLTNWYKRLGWNPDTHTIDPTKVKVSVNTNKRLMDSYTNQFSREIRINAMFAWMNYGPSVKDMPDDEVILEDGWIVEHVNNGVSRNDMEG